MIENILCDFEVKVLDTVGAALDMDPEYRQCIDSCVKQYQKIKSYLPDDEAFSLMDELDSSFAVMERTSNIFYYKQGIKDGITLFKKLRSSGVIKVNSYSQTFNPYKYSYEFEKEYNQLNEREKAQYKNLAHYMYIKAYEKGFKDGHKEALA